MFLSPELKLEHNRIKALHNFGSKAEDKSITLGSINFEIKENKIDEVMTKVDSLVKEYGEMFQDYLSIVAEGHRLCIGISIP